MIIVSSGLRRLRSLSIRAKLAVTVLAAVVGVLGGSTFLSYRFWQQEARFASEQQALLAAAATRGAIETSLRAGRTDVAQRNLRRLVRSGTVVSARLFDANRTVTFAVGPLSSVRLYGTWIPNPKEFPRSGMAGPADKEGSIRAFIPIEAPGVTLLEIVVAESPVQAAMRHGAYLGIGMTGLSVLIVALLIVTMFEREVVRPIHRVEDLLPDDRGPTRDTDLVGIERSVTRLLERERAVEALAADRARRLRAQDGLAQVGGLATEMAHEFKRPLALIRTAVNVLDQEYLIEDGGRKLLDAVNIQLERLSETMEDLFSLAKPVELGDDLVDVANSLDDALLQLSGMPGAKAVTIGRCYERGHKVIGDQHRLTQAFSNLLTNAVEAMPKGGDLIVSTRLMDTRRLRVSVQDSGAGMSEDEAKRAVRPFYSTKPFGTGLGLSVVARIIAAHGGELTIQGGPDGTVVTVELPVLEPQVLESVS